MGKPVVLGVPGFLYCIQFPVNHQQMFLNIRLSRPITSEWTSLACVCVCVRACKCFSGDWGMSMQHSNPVVWSCGTSANLLQRACHVYLQLKIHCHAHTHTHNTHTRRHTLASASKTAEPHMEKPTVKYSEECVESSAGPLSCGRHKWCFVWAEDSGTQLRSLFHVLEAF